MGRLAQTLGVTSTTVLLSHPEKSMIHFTVARIACASALAITSASAPALAATAPNYEVSIDSLEVSQIRSQANDTVFIKLQINIGDKIFKTDNVSVGDIKKPEAGQVRKIDLTQLGKPVTVAIGAVLDTAPITITYTIMNSGHDGASETEKLADSAISLLTAKAALVDPLSSLLGLFAKYGKGLAFANCDGPLAIANMRWIGNNGRVLPGAPTTPVTQLTGMALRKLTQTSAVSPQKNTHPGVDSSAGCGPNSDYTVNWSIAKTLK